MTHRTTYMRFFETRDEAFDHMRTKNQTDCSKTIYVLMDGPEDNFAVSDLSSAIEMDMPYEWSVK